ncbi:hypothetical protein [Slackia isoflavoniconvertens]|uniref:hypothetical protein n=1 Tax=Slackia isoflavoniconvertens TaxID=572010 RepID=UPI003F9CC59E
MLSESVDSAEKEPNDRSQPQISAIFPHLGTRSPQVEWAFHKKMDAGLRQRPKPNVFAHRAFDGSTPNGTRARQRRPSDGASKKV